MSPLPRFSIGAVVALAVVLLFPNTAPAQGWRWPEKAENLKVLADTTSAEMLSRIMRGFTSSLGVRCVHCHVGEEGKPLSDYDFPADDKRAKRVARDMLRMVRMINTDVISKLEEPSGATVACFTCHRGQQTPPAPLDHLLIDTLDAAGVEAALKVYEKLREDFYGSGVYNFGARTFTRVADRLLDENRNDEAIAFLDRGMREHPDDALIQFYLGRAYLAKADTTVARLHLERALTLEPESPFIRRSLESLVVDR